MKDIFLTPYRAHCFSVLLFVLFCFALLRKLDWFAPLRFSCEKFPQNSTLWVHLLMVMTTGSGFLAELWAMYESFRKTYFVYTVVPFFTPLVIIEDGVRRLKKYSPKVIRSNSISESSSGYYEMKTPQLIG